MFRKNIEIVLNRISDTDIVLDIGGWAQPFNRANFVIDIMPYETRGFWGSIGSDKECFSKDTWIFHDLSPKKPLPFRDKEIDFVICSHVLEDIRDPIYLCSEIQRIGKRGYIEVPSRTIESIMGLEGRRYAGFCHHRWLIKIENSEIIFRFKPHILHESWKYHFPKSYYKRLGEADKFESMFWEDRFGYKEVINVSLLKVVQELEEFVKHRKAYPKPYYLFGCPKELVKGLLRRFPQLKKMAGRFTGKPIMNRHDADRRFLLNVPDIYSE